MQPKSNPALESAPSFASASRCLFADSRGHRCRMLRSDAHPALCVFHARQERHLLESERIGAELATLSGEFKTATDINAVLGKLFSLLASGRIPRRDAAVLAYIGQLLANTLPGVKYEIQQVRGIPGWEQTLRSAFSRQFSRGEENGTPAPR
ncbi:MAG: hypothetical protein LAN84_03140 [Acidobacteriia bacterium]|nr:hypothetical protein [Terriglobia bacterium]